MLTLALDFGGTKLAAGLVDAKTGQVFAAEQCPTPDDAASGYAAMLDMAETLVVRAAEQPHAAGVSFGGPVEADGRTVRYSMHIHGWENAALATWIERDMVLPCAIANDADAAALAEQRYGAGREVMHLLYLTVSTGIGGGIVIGGTIYRGARAWAGEVGHQVLDPKGPPCACGRNGCLESLASGRGVARAAKVALNELRSNLDLLQAEDMTPAQHNSSLLRLPIEQITAQTVAEAVATGDVLASTVWERAMTWLGIGIANAANVLNPALVVLGGGLTRAGALLFEPVRQVVAQRVLDPGLKIVPAALGEHIGLLGGAAIAADMLNMSE
jgi:glucokinase